MVEGPSLLTMCRLQGRAAGGDGQAFFFFNFFFKAVWSFRCTLCGAAQRHLIDCCTVARRQISLKSMIIFDLWPCYE